MKVNQDDASRRNLPCTVACRSGQVLGLACSYKQNKRVELGEYTIHLIRVSVERVGSFLGAFLFLAVKIVIDSYLKLKILNNW